MIGLPQKGQEVAAVFASATICPPQELQTKTPMASASSALHSEPAPTSHFIFSCG